MKTRTKLFILLLTVSVLVFSFSGCSKGIQPDDGRTVLSVGEYDICYDIFRYIFLSVRDDLCDGDLNYYVDNALGQVDVVDGTIDVLRRYYSIKVLAKENGVELEDADKLFSDYFDSYKASVGSDDAVKSDLEKNYLTEYSLKEMYLLLSLRTELYNRMTEEGGKLYIGDDEMIKKVKDDFLCFRYIFVDQSGTETEEYALSRINEAYKKAADGEDFKKLIEEYSESSSFGEAEDYSCYFARGGFSDEKVEEAAETLKVGEISEIIETDDGWFIIQKTEKDEEYIKKNLASMRKSYSDVVFSELLDSTAETLEVKYSELFNTINVLTIK